MQPHEQHDPKPDPPKPKEPDRRDKRAKWLLFVNRVVVHYQATTSASYKRDHFQRPVRVGLVRQSSSPAGVSRPSGLSSASPSSRRRRI